MQGFLYHFPLWKKDFKVYFNFTSQTLPGSSLNTLIWWTLLTIELGKHVLLKTAHLSQMVIFIIRLLLYAHFSHTSAF